MATIDLEKRAILLKLYPDVSAKHIRLLLEDEDRFKLEKMYLPDVVNFILNNYEKDSISQETANQIRKIIEDSNYSIEIYQHVFRRDVDNSGKIIADYRKQKLLDEKYFEKKIDPFTDKEVYQSEIRVVPSGSNIQGIKTCFEDKERISLESLIY